MEIADVSHRMVNLMMYILTSGVLFLQAGLILAQGPQPTIILTPSTGKFDNIPIGGTISISCTVALPEDYILGTREEPSTLVWEMEKAQVELTRNATVLTEDLRMSVEIYEDDNSHSSQLTITDIKSSDSGLYRCYTYVSQSSPVQHPPVKLSESVYLSVGYSLSDVIPQCYIRPGEVILEDLSIMPTCFVKRNDDFEKILVQWTKQYPNGSTKIILDPTVKMEGFNYESYYFEVDTVKSQDDGVRYICDVMLDDNTAVVQHNCTTDAMDVIQGAELSTDSLVSQVGETLSVLATIQLPEEFFVSMTTWSKAMNGVHQLIIRDDDVNTGMVDADRYSIQKVVSNNTFQSTLTISDLKRIDAGNYACHIVVSSYPDINIGNDYLRTFQIAVASTLPTTPELQTEPLESDSERWMTSIKAATGILIIIIILVVISACVMNYRRFQRARRASSGDDNKSPKEVARNNNLNLSAIAQL